MLNIVLYLDLLVFSVTYCKTLNIVVKFAVYSGYHITSFVDHLYNLEHPEFSLNTPSMSICRTSARIQPQHSFNVHLQNLSQNSTSTLFQCPLSKP